MLAAGAQVVNGAGDQFFARAGLTLYEDDRVGRGDRLDRLQRAFQRVAVTDDLGEVVTVAKLFFEVEFFVGELVLQFFDLAKGEGVLYRDGDLRSDLVEKLDVFPCESRFAKGGDSQGAERAVMRDERQAAPCAESLGEDAPREIGIVPFNLLDGQQYWLPRNDGAPRRSIFERREASFAQQAFAFGEIKRVHPQSVSLRIVERQAGVVVRHHATQTLGDNAEQLVQIKVGDDGMVVIKK